MNCNKNTIVRWLLLGFFAAHLILGHPGMSRLVLCIGGNGHVEIETAIAGAACNDFQSMPLTSKTLRLPVFTSESSLSHCGDCVDLPVFSECHEYAKIQLKNSLKTPGFLTLKPSLSGLPKTIENRDKSRILNVSIFNDPSLVSLQTTVLLI